MEVVRARLFWPAVLVPIIALLALLGYGVLRQQGSTFAGFGVNTVGQAREISPRPAADFTLPLFDGGQFQLSQQRGKVVLINYWASWCPPCRQEAPALEEAWRRYGNQGVVLVGVDIWDNPEDARAFVRDFRISYPTGLDTTGRIAIEYGVTGIPETYFVNRDGVLVRRWIGPLSSSQIGSLLEDLLPAPTAQDKV